MLVINLLNVLINFKAFDKFVNSSLILINGRNKMKLLTTNTKIDKSMKLYPEYEASILQMLPGKGVCVNTKIALKNA